MTTWLVNFPEDVQAEILTRLNIKTLLRLMCTCKSIYNLVSSPTLLITNSVRGADKHIYSYRSFDGQQKFLLYHDTEKQFKILEELSSITIDITYFLIGSVYGLVCFAKTFHDPNESDIVLWNPFLGKSVVVPISIVAREKSSAIGFGFDHHCLDYKVVRVGIVHGYNTCCADVYVVREGYWKKVVGSISRPALRIMGDSVFMNNTIHWILKISNFTPGENCEQYSILAYDLSKEVFREMYIDQSMGQKTMSLTKLSIKGEEKLVLYCDDQYHDFYMWVMGEYGVVDSWSKICILKSKSHDEFIKVLHTRKNGEIVFTTTRGGLFMCKIEADGKDIKEIKNDGIQLDYVGPFVKSLVFVEQPCVSFLHDKTISISDINAMDEDEADDEEEKIEVEEEIEENVNRQHEDLISFVSHNF